MASMPSSMRCRSALTLRVVTLCLMSIAEAMDEMIKWFCILFGNQFTPDEVLDYYPVDRLMHDIAFALMAVQTQTTHVLNEFPTKAAQTSQEETPQV